MKKSKKVSARSATRKSATKKGRKAADSAISTSSPLGMLALHLREQWKKSGRDGLVFLAEDENRAERLGGIVHALDPSLDVLVFPRLNTLPFDGLEPSREIAGRRSARRDTVHARQVFAAADRGRRLAEQDDDVTFVEEV